ncbi:hypothetical protein HaLaN_16028, partial [Haematococcus lacustris]
MRSQQLTGCSATAIALSRSHCGGTLIPETSTTTTIVRLLDLTPRT